MRSKLVVSLLGLIFAGSGLAAVVVEKRSHEMPYVEVFGCDGVHAFVFRGPKGTSRRPILVPPREYWSASEAGQYKFWLRDGSGHVCARLVTPEVFARYRVGDDFNDCGPAIERTTEDNKSVQPVVHHRRHTDRCGSGLISGRSRSIIAITSPTDSRRGNPPALPYSSRAARMLQ
jgi:hypothetical protein